MSFDIRAYTPADRDEVARLWDASWRASGLARAEESALDNYRARLDGEGRDWTILLACADGTIVGFIALHLAENRVRQLFVLPSCQRMRLGTRLLEEARRLMPGGFWLRTDRDNRPARRFYETRGLRLESEAAHPERGHPIATYRWA